ncbi:MAG: metallophosphoesterase [Deltaproteobacteria bacterium]|nr:MAG: metallophosphoesterase [Deltaproteobacteria bacterium]
MLQDKPDPGVIKIGCLSDTHLSGVEDCRRLADRLLEGVFADVDLILHAGDIGSEELLFCLAPVEVLAVAGNTDVGLTHHPAQRVFRRGGVCIAMAHGWGAGERVSLSLWKYFADRNPDVIVFGHSHVPENRKRGQTLMFNPGSPTRPRSSFGPSVGVLTLCDGRVEARIFPLTDTF